MKEKGVIQGAGFPIGVANMGGLWPPIAEGLLEI